MSLVDAKSIFLKVKAEDIIFSFEFDGISSLSRISIILVNPSTKWATSELNSFETSSIEQHVSSTTSCKRPAIIISSSPPK